MSTTSIALSLDRMEIDISADKHTLNVTEKSLGQRFFFQAGNSAARLTDSRIKDHVYTIISEKALEAGDLVASEYFGKWIKGLGNREEDCHKIFDTYMSRKEFSKALEVPELYENSNEKDKSYSCLAIAYAEEKNVYQARMVKDAISNPDLRKTTLAACDSIFLAKNVPR